MYVYSLSDWILMYEHPKYINAISRALIIIITTIKFKKFLPLICFDKTSIMIFNENTLYAQSFHLNDFPHIFINVKDNILKCT